MRQGSERIGLTGGIASGKSTVSALLAERGAVIVDADELAREVVAPGTDGLAAVVDRFGPEVLAPDGSLDRPALASLVFSDPQARADLNALIHPRVRSLAAQRRRAVQDADPDAVVIDVIPLLVETGQADAFDTLVVVDLPEPLQRARLRARNGLSEDQARARLAAQASRAERLAIADVVIDNTGGLEELAPQVDALWERLRPRR